MEGLIAFIMAGFALAGSPGPATLSVAAAASAFGARKSIPYITGIVAGMIIVMLMIASGVIGMMITIPGALPVVTIIAALYIAYLAFSIATAPPLGEQRNTALQPSFIRGLFLSFINPKGYAAMAALFSSFVLLEGRLIEDAALKIFVMVAVMTVVYGVWLCVGTALNRVAANRRINRIINISFAALLLASVIFAFLF